MRAADISEDLSQILVTEEQIRAKLDELAARVATRVIVLGDGEVVAEGDARSVLAGSLFAPQVLRVVPPFLTVAEVERALVAGGSAR